MVQRHGQRMLRLKSRDSRLCNSAVAGTSSTQQQLETETDCLEMLPCCRGAGTGGLRCRIAFPYCCCWLIAVEGFWLLTGWPADLDLRGKAKLNGFLFCFRFSPLEQKLNMYSEKKEKKKGTKEETKKNRRFETYLPTR